MRRTLLGLMPVALLAAACGGGPQTTASTTTASQPSAADVLLRCDQVPLPATDESLYRDTPKYVGNEMPVEEVRAWASQYPEFVDIWIDRERNGWVIVAFTANATERQTEIEAEFPDDGVVAVEVGWTADDLSDLQSRVHEDLEGVVEVEGSWTDPLRGYVGIHIPILSEENLAAIEERFPDARLCVEGLDPEAVVQPGPQPQEGDGWRLLVDQKGAGFPYITGLGWDEESLLGLVENTEGLDEFDIDVDWDNEVVVFFGAVHSGSCPNIRMDDVVVDGDTIHPVIVNTDNAFACTDDANPHLYVVALDRARLPAPPFYVLINPDLLWDRLQVDADLRDPGSTADAGQVGPDTDPPEPAPEGSGLLMETGFPWEYTVDLSCGFQAIGEINFYHWVASEPIPTTWAEATEDSDSVVVGVLLHEGPDPYLEVTYQGETVTYQPTDQAGCG